MVLCLIALPVFAVLAVFSVKYRRLLKDSLHCVARKATLRKCESGLEDRIKAGITGSLIPYSPKTAGFVYKHYTILSWIFVVIMVWSMVIGGIGVYNYYLYGNCNG